MKIVPPNKDNFKTIAVDGTNVFVPNLVTDDSLDIIKTCIENSKKEGFQVEETVKNNSDYSFGIFGIGEYKENSTGGPEFDEKGRGKLVEDCQFITFKKIKSVSVFALFGIPDEALSVAGESLIEELAKETGIEDLTYQNLFDHGFHIKLEHHKESIEKYDIASHIKSEEEFTTFVEENKEHIDFSKEESKLRVKQSIVILKVIEKADIKQDYPEEVETVEEDSNTNPFRIAGGVMNTITSE